MVAIHDQQRHPVGRSSGPEHAGYAVHVRPGGEACSHPLVDGAKVHVDARFGSKQVSLAVCHHCRERADHTSGDPAQGDDGGDAHANVEQRQRRARPPAPQAADDHSTGQSNGASLAPTLVLQRLDGQQATGPPGGVGTAHQPQCHCRRQGAAKECGGQAASEYTQQGTRAVGSKEGQHPQAAAHQTAQQGKCGRLAQDHCQHPPAPPSQTAQHADLARALKDRHKERVGHDDPTEDNGQARNGHGHHVQHLEHLLLVGKPRRRRHGQVRKTTLQPNLQLICLTGVFEPDVDH